MDQPRTTHSPRPPRRSPSARARSVALRRRRAAALGLVAVVALAIGLVVGGSSGSSRPHPPAAAREVGYLARLATLAGTGSGSLAAAQQRLLGDAVDRTLAYTPYVRMAGGQHREVALTFDDGPGPYTPQILDVLERMHAPATFFEIGEEERYFSASTRRIVEMGDPIGDHTWNHLSMSSLTRAQQSSELLRQAAAIGRYGAPFPRMFRPPYGDFNQTTLDLLKKYRMLMVLWSIDTVDWERPGVDAIVDAVLEGAKPGAIVEMHDAGGDRSQTVAALPRIIDGLRARGYKLVTVPQLLLDNPAPRRQDVGSVRGTGA